MKNYDHKKIEKKWQKEWATKNVYKTENNSKKKKMYVLDMFPYPSGAGLHVGHPRGYIGSDVYARMKRMEGYNVLHPMGYDAFGLPAEQYAMEHKIHPGKAVEENVKTFERQLSIIGLSYDWKRKVNTTDPKYYKWTQWIFLEIYNSWFDNSKKKARKIDELVSIFEKSGNRKVDAFCSNDTPSFDSKEWKNFSKKEKHEMLMKYRLAYEGYSEVNWCPKLGTVLANDEIVNDKDGNPISERGGYPVEKKLMRQWFMRITAYAERLLNNLNELDWSNHIKEIQKNWIGKSEGSEIEFNVRVSKKFSSGPRMREDEGLDHSENLLENSHSIKVFTTRADTIFGATYVVLAPEHKLVSDLKSEILNWEEVNKYISQIKNKTDEDRTKADKEKTGVELKGVTAINPANGEEIPIWIADYVLASYGTGAVMAVPAHDERDFEFAKKFNQLIRQSIVPLLEDKENPWVEGKPLTKRRVVHVLLRRKDGQILILDWKGDKWINKRPVTLIIGGVEEGEDLVSAAKREVKEETGFVNLKFVEQIPILTRAKFYAAHKEVNRLADVSCLVFDLIDDEKVEVSDEEKNIQDYKFVTIETALRLINIPDDYLFVNYFIKPTAYIEDGSLTNSGKFDGMSSLEARKEITKFVGGKIVTKYKMRDAIFARQRYWGEPIPLKHNSDGTITELKLKNLPLELPKVKSYESTGTGESPLSLVKSWIKDGYETNTMPGWAGSSWYFLRYMDPTNEKKFASDKAISYWKNVDMYVGGQEHATGHLLYSRFWNNFLFDMGYIVSREPFKKLVNQGMILATDGRKMSKRWGNVINPDEIVLNYGADTLRVYEMFMGPFDQSLPWSTESIIGSRRFIDRVDRIRFKISKNKTELSLEKLIHKTIKKVTEDIENFAFNTAISSMMILINEMEKNDSINIKDFKMFIQILAPFAPHITEEIWHDLGEKSSIHLSPWPKWDKNKVINNEVKIAIQVNGKVRAEINIGSDLSEEEVRSVVLNDKNVKTWIENKEIKRFIYVKGRVVNIVV